MAKKKKTTKKTASRKKTAAQSAGSESAPARSTSTSGGKQSRAAKARLEEAMNRIERTDIQHALSRGDRVVPVEIDNQMKEAYLDYAMSVIVGRALP
ncbi:MAG: hypothetical protein KDK30_18380, partial [Leptospiraceae bacterium]|nr:hypothetical protein [Leptospiraceae bacterium]